MNNTRKNLKFLSKSVLLEETGLPRMNTYIILAISTIITLFLLWSNYMIVYDTVSVSGYVLENGTGSSNYSYMYKVSSRNMSLIKSGQNVKLSIPGITVKETIPATISQVRKNAMYDNQGRVYYEIQVRPHLSEKYQAKLNNTLINGMEINGEVVIGSRTLLQYFLGPLWDVGQKAFAS